MTPVRSCAGRPHRSFLLLCSRRSRRACCLAPQRMLPWSDTGAGGVLMRPHGSDAAGGAKATPPLPGKKAMPKLPGASKAAEKPMPPLPGGDAASTPEPASAKRRPRLDTGAAGAVMGTSSKTPPPATPASKMPALPDAVRTESDESPGGPPPTYSPEAQRTLRRAQLLKQVPMMADLSMKEHTDIAAEFDLVKFKSGAVIVRQGTASDAMYIVETGSAYANVDGERTEKYNRGGVFGDLAPFGELASDTYKATVTAVGPCDCLRLGQASFLKLTQTLNLSSPTPGEQEEKQEEEQPEVDEPEPAPAPERTVSPAAQAVDASIAARREAAVTSLSPPGTPGTPSASPLSLKREPASPLTPTSLSAAIVNGDASAEAQEVLRQQVVHADDAAMVSRDTPAARRITATRKQMQEAAAAHATVQMVGESAAAAHSHASQLSGKAVSEEDAASWAQLIETHGEVQTKGAKLASILASMVVKGAVECGLAPPDEKVKEAIHPRELGAAQDAAQEAVAAVESVDEEKVTGQTRTSSIAR